MAMTSVNTAMDIQQPRGGLARAVGLIGAVCALCGVTFWAVAGRPGQASAAPQVQLYVPNSGFLPAVSMPVEQPPAPLDERESQRQPSDPDSMDTPARAGPPSMLADATQGPITSLEQLALNDDLKTVVRSDNMCTRRAAMARAAGLAAGLALATVNQPGFAAETKMVKMGSDSGQLVFVPDEIKICKGDTVTWTNNKGGPHNVVFEEDGVPSGVSAEKISMDDQLGDEGATYSLKFDTSGTYNYYCEPHAGGGMKASIVVG